MDLLRGYGIAPGESPEQEPDDEADPPGSIGTGVLADIARHLQTAFTKLDPELFASLLHPQVRWAQCSTSDEVLDWYRRLLAAGTRPVIGSIEVDGDTVILGMTVTWAAEGARPAPPELLYQAFTVAGAEIVRIRGYPDRASALTRG
jgi:hypothetical protein